MEGFMKKALLKSKKAEVWHVNHHVLVLF